MYQHSMEKVVKDDKRLRAWGTKGNLDTQLTTAKGAKTKITVYIVAGFHPDRDENAFGFIKVQPDVREPTEKENVSTAHPPETT